jgi:hypothetical protein
LSIFQYQIENHRLIDETKILQDKFLRFFLILLGNHLILHSNDRFSV